MGLGEAPLQLVQLARGEPRPVPLLLRVLVIQTEEVLVVPRLPIEVDPELVVVDGPGLTPAILVPRAIQAQASHASSIEVRGVCLSDVTARIQKLGSCNVNHVSPLSHIDFSDNGATFGFNVN